MEDNTQQFTKTSKNPSESYFLSHNLSGRFWIALVLAVGWIASTVLIFCGTIKLDSNAAIAVYTGFSGGATTIITMYMGQNARPKAQENSPNENQTQIVTVKP